jgi:23S rRNA pseudouridine2457 synthase
MEYNYLLLLAINKPFNTVCQFRPHADDMTLADYISTPGVYPAGRLDKDSEGLLLLTDDGELQHLLTQPRHKLAKGYWVQVEGIPEETALDQLRRGVPLKDGMTRPAEVNVMAPPAVWERIPPIRERKALPTSWLDLTIYEGRNRQVRRMTAAVGHPTLRLIRYRIGPWYLDDLPPGQVEERSIPAEIRRRLPASRKIRDGSRRRAQ